ncbi:hypothetical protein BD289DRAFT_396186 [Coniella lustricola]|uniref:Uncharacterized protein n=1 Tax=Coniella lustricola TaxID=2025994 RepID=A0A2T2ZXW4_9PEZI|nr:hypothetical protein BD289DRAFT_396186 [Coniella lustricola]
MATSASTQPPEVIDLTADSDDDVKPRLPDRDAIAHIVTNGHPPPFHNRPAPNYEPPSKRQRVNDTRQHHAPPDFARMVADRHAQMAAARAAALDPGVLEGAVTERLRGLLYQQFADRLAQSETIDKALNKDIVRSRESLLRHLTSLPECRRQTHVPIPSYATPFLTPTAIASPATIPPQPTPPTKPAGLMSAGPASSVRRRATKTPIKARTFDVASSMLTSPENFSSRAKKAAWASPAAKQSEVNTDANSFFALQHRPYARIDERDAILRGLGRLRRLNASFLQESQTFHVAFTLDEARLAVAAVAREAQTRLKKVQHDEPYRDLAKLLRPHYPVMLRSFAESIWHQFPGRQVNDVHKFLQDVWQARHSLVSRRAASKQVQTQEIWSLERDTYDIREEKLRESRLSSLLLAREMTGSRLSSTRRFINYHDEFRNILDDGLEMRCEFTNCAGDLATISWVSNQAYVAGTTVHMDSHNLQYNKPGNMVLGSITRGAASLKAYADHKIPRPLVERGENSTEAMRESQSPWLYTSVVSSDYDAQHDRVYSSSFDKTVKVWKIDQGDTKMRCICTWEHQGLVNFVEASTLQNVHFSLVATAADVPSDAIRIYRVSNDDAQIANSSYRSFSCARITGLDGSPMPIDKWTYYPSTMRWGLEQTVKHLLLVGYSPRSLKGDDNDIPIECLNTGELCLWDSITGLQIQITSAKKQNVFEVLWHPSQPVFIAATSPTGVALNFDRVKTQVRIFKRIDGNGYIAGSVFSEIRALDCYAADINELTVMPNSASSCYVTAGCTNGKTYVWDTALGDKPIQVLSHGPPVAGVAAGDHEDDTGVKFTAWGASMARFYTGSSDGVVKVWNVRSTEAKAQGRVILEAPAQISFGAFSPDKSKLVIGDASGRVFILSIDHEDGSPPSFVQIPGGGKKRMPTTITMHSDPPPPQGTVSSDGRALGTRYLANRQLYYSGDPTVGMVQDINYPETGLYLREAYLDQDTNQPMLGHIEVHLQSSTKIYSNYPLKTRVLKNVVGSANRQNSKIFNDDFSAETQEEHRTEATLIIKQHEENCNLDLEFKKLSMEIRDVLAGDNLGEQELYQGIDYQGIVEDDDVELNKARVEVLDWDPITKEWGEQTGVWV